MEAGADTEEAGSAGRDKKKGEGLRLDQMNRQGQEPRRANGTLAEQGQRKGRDSGSIK
jgi:hypothetical protein